MTNTNSTSSKTEWQYVDLYDCNSGEGSEVPFGANADRIRILREYRRTGGTDSVFLCTSEQYRSAGDDASDLGPSVEQIDWTGFPE